MECVFYSATNKLLISDTILRSFVPPQVSKTTPRLRQICGYELCIIPKDMQIYLNRPRTKLVSVLQHKYDGRNKLNSSYITTSAAHYNDKVFSDSECLHATIKYACQFISFTPIKPDNIIHMQCALGFCDECNK